MTTRLSKRLYTQSALEFWLQRLGRPWEQYFKENELTLGRSVYRTGNVKEVELGETDAIVTAKVGDFDGYAVIDWSDPKISIRSSTENRLYGYAIAAAGLYEIEELVSDEVPPLPPEKLSKPEPDLAAENAQDGEAGARLPGDLSGQPQRLLKIRFHTEEQGLAFDVFWSEWETGKTIPALGENALAAEHITSDDRERLIRLASLARRSKFRFRRRRSGYIMEELERTCGFVRNELPRWRKFFDIEIAPDVFLLEEGVREAELLVRAEDFDDEEVAGEASEKGQLELGFSPKGKQRSGSANSMRLRWDLLIGGDTLNAQEARLLTKKGDQTALVPGRGLIRLRPEAASSLDELTFSLQDREGGTAPRYFLFSLFGDGDQKTVLTPALEQWRSSVMELKDNAEAEQHGLASAEKSPELSADCGFEKLRPYQLAGVQWMEHLGRHDCHGLLADEMGLGKTLQALSLLAGFRNRSIPSLVVCPASVVPVWCEEMRRFYPEMPFAVVQKGTHFGQPEAVDGLLPDIQPVWICSYTQLRRHKQELDKTLFDFVVLDEAQFIKNPEAKVTVSCMAIRAERRLAMTGTPVENRLLDLWTIFRFLMPGLLGPRRGFEELAQKDPPALAAKVQRQIGPFVLRRTKKQVAQELPPKSEFELICPMTDLQKREYNRLIESAREELGSDFGEAARYRAVNVLSLLTRLRQCCCDPAQLPGVSADATQSGKLNVLNDRLTELIENGHKVVIFSQFTGVLERVKQSLRLAFPDTPLEVLTGATRDRSEPVQRFQKGKGAAVMLVSLRAGGTGITLHAAEYVFLMDPWWNPAVEQQAIDRVHRIGQKKRVFVYRMISAGTIEERMQQLQKEKSQLFDASVGQLEDGTDLSRIFESWEALLKG